MFLTCGACARMVESMTGAHHKGPRKSGLSKFESGRADRLSRTGCGSIFSGDERGRYKPIDYRTPDLFPCGFGFCDMEFSTVELRDCHREMRGHLA